MPRRDRALKIAYIGGGSYFTQHLLHGLAARAEAFGELGRSVELVLMDIVVANAEPRRRYAEIVARRRGLDLATTVTDDRPAALDGADWVLFSIGAPRQRSEAFAGVCEPLGEVSCESGPAAAAEAAAIWPVLAEIAGEMKRRAPNALLSTLVNPTDVLAGAFQKAFALRAAGMCVEVPQLQCWLAGYLNLRPRDIVLEHVGGNHVGWVTRWTAAGQDGDPLLARVLDEVRGTDRWNPNWDWFADAFRRFGHMPTSPYHNWPHQRVWDEAGQQRYHAAQGPHQGREHRRRVAEEALAAGEMVGEREPPDVPYEHRSFNWLNTRHTLGAVAAGLAGAATQCVPLQVRNGGTNPPFAADAWLEVPTRIDNASPSPQSVPQPKAEALALLEPIVRQRTLLADWLAGGDESALRAGLLAFPDGRTPDALQAFADSLLALRREIG